MPIKITIHKELILPKYWVNDEDYLEMGGTKEDLIELLNEDWTAFLEDCGNLDGLIQNDNEKATLALSDLLAQAQLEDVKKQLRDKWREG